MKPAPRAALRKFLSESAKSLCTRATPRCLGLWPSTAARSSSSIKLPRYDYDEIIDALEGEEDDAADSGGEDYELVG